MNSSKPPNLFNSNYQLVRIHENTQISLKSIYFEFFEQWKDWLQYCGVSQDYQRDIQTALDKIFQHEIHSPSDILEFVKKLKCNRKYHQLAFRKWVKFCEEKDIFDENYIMKLKNKVKVNERSKIDGYVPNDTEINTMLTKVDSYCELSSIFLRVLLDSGLRISEVTHFLHNIDLHKAEYHEEVVVIPLYYLRGNKNSYYVFLSKETYNLVLKNKEQFREYTVVKLKQYIKRHKCVALKYYRKYQFTKMIQCGISLDIANFIQGRVSQNIGFNHYLAKKEIALKEYIKFIY